VRLPGNAVGITDINTYRDCPSRFEFGMKRWWDGREPPEKKHPDTMYGSAIHHGIERMEVELMTVEEAVQDAFDHYGPYLDPDAMERLEKDLQTYVDRDAQFADWRPVSVEDEFKVPLLRRDGVTYYYRFKIDRLYQNPRDPTQFAHVDYKSSKWRKSEEEVHKDPQMWSYNWGIHEVFPECESLIQFYDQLMYGIVPTRKSPEQRRQIKRWLQRQVNAILDNEDPEPKLNDWCPWCPILESCPEPRRAAQFARARIAALAPEDQETGNLDIDPDLVEEYVAQLQEDQIIKKSLDRFDEAIKGLLRDMPDQHRQFYGYTLGGRNIDVWTPSGLRTAHEILGDDFYAVIKMTKGRVNEYLKGDDRRKQLLDLAVKEGQSPSVTKVDPE
jgi:hypothetical protein